MRIVSIVGARPQFVKALPVSRALTGLAEEVLVHTGQHYSDTLSGAQFASLDLPAPRYNLEVGSGSHAEQMARVLVRVEQTLATERPDLVLVYGDTNSTLGAALAAAKLGYRLAHVEAGPRTGQRRSAEEVNRVLTDHLSDLLFCPTPLSLHNLAREGLADRAYLTGDVMADTFRLLETSFRESARTLRDIRLEPDSAYVVLTAHRAEHVDRREGLIELVDVLAAIDLPVIFPIHPRTNRRLAEAGLLPRLDALPGVHLVPPVDYVEMMRLSRQARAILTDSGGLQKEAYLLGVPCLTLANVTGWPETLDGGWNTLVGFDPRKVKAALRRCPSSERRPVFGDGHAATRIVEILKATLG